MHELAAIRSQRVASKKQGVPVHMGWELGMLEHSYNILQHDKIWHRLLHLVWSGYASLAAIKW